ncbi:MAG: trigger factor [Myxococcales bacterium]|nr:trigger factor [Myxococcales bacterium]
MQVNVQRISPVVMELAVEVPVQTVKAEIDKAYTNLARKAHIKGFRPGKAPRSVLTHLFSGQVATDVANVLVNDTLPRILTEKNVTPVSTPQVEPGALNASTAFSYKARFEVSPEIKEVVWEGFDLIRPKIEVEDKMVDEWIDRLRQGMSTLKAPEPARPTKANDVVTIDFTLSVGGKEIKDGGGQGVQLELGAGQVLPELDAALLGKAVGDKFEVDAKFPDEHPRDDFKGKTGRFAVTITESKEKVLPKLDDEFAKDMGSFQTLVELRADVHDKLTKQVKDQSEIAVAEQVVTKLNESNKVDVPPSLVEQQTRIMEQEFVMQARRMGQRFTQAQAQEVGVKIRIDAERKVRAGLLMAAIAQKLEMKITEADIEKGLEELAQETGKNVAKLRVEYREKSKRDMLVGMILEDKILDLIEGKAKIKEGTLEEAQKAQGGSAGEAKAEAKSDAKPEGDAPKSEKGEGKAKSKKAKKGEDE